MLHGTLPSNGGQFSRQYVEKYSCIVVVVAGLLVLVWVLFMLLYLDHHQASIRQACLKMLPAYNTRVASHCHVPDPKASSHVVRTTIYACVDEGTSQTRGTARCTLRPTRWHQVHVHGESQSKYTTLCGSSSTIHSYRFCFFSFPPSNRFIIKI